MATQTTTKTLTMVAEFADGDTRTLTVSNPDTSKNLVSLVNDLSDFCKENQILLGDKNSADFSKIGEAKINQKTISKLEIA